MTVGEGLNSAYRMLELEPGSTFAQVRRAYLDLVQVWHPDRFSASNPRLQKTAQERFLSINDAYNLLKRHAEEQRAVGLERAAEESAWVMESRGPCQEGLAVAAFRRRDHAEVVHGYVDYRGRIVIEPQFSDAAEFSEGLAAVRMTGTLFWGYINRTGAFVIEPQYVYAGNFSGGRARVSQGGPLSYIGKPEAAR